VPRASHLLFFELASANAFLDCLLLPHVSHIRLKFPPNKVLLGENLVLGQKIFEGKGKSGAGFIKSVSMEGVKQVYSWTAQVKGFGQANGVECFLAVTAKGMTPPKGLGTAKDIGVFNTPTGEMGTLKGYDIAKMVEGKTMSVGLWSFMTMAEKLSWLNDVIAVVTFEALDPMWQEFNITIYEWK
jgi:hypothetical protein